MLLSKFILSNLEEILSEWQSFASTVLPRKQFNKAMLRDDAAEILKTIASDMETAQTAAQQTEKSKGRGPKTAQDPLRKGIVMFDLGKALTRSKLYQNFVPFAPASFGSG